MFVEAWLERAAALRPTLVAIETPSGSATYAQLLADARAGAAELAARGLSPGDLVAIALPAGLEFARALHATLLLGAVAVPVDLRLHHDERCRILEDVAAVVEEPLALSGPGASSAPARPAEALAARPERSGRGEPSAIPGPAQHTLQATAAVIYTSGTTSAPRSVPLSYGNFLWSALGSAVALGLAPNERWLCAMPLSHVAGLSILLRSAIYATTAVVHEQFETEHALQALREQEITLVSLVAATLRRLLDAGLERPPTLRCALTGGGPVPSDLVSRADRAGVPVRLTYGLTEACSQVATAALAAADGGVRPLFCTRVRTAPRSGEILVSGPTVTPSRAVSGGWLHTGDLGRLDSHGCLHVAGRESDTIISGGEKVTPAEVEDVLAEHPDVMEVAVVGRPDARWGELVSAVVVAKAGAQLDCEDLRTHCARYLAAYKLPRHLELVAGPLPRTSSGKLLRRELTPSAATPIPARASQ
jgi:o-succinylbenzoate---CoA ligase